MAGRIHGTKRIWSSLYCLPTKASTADNIKLRWNQINLYQTLQALRMFFVVFKVRYHWYDLLQLLNMFRFHTEYQYTWVRTYLKYNFAGFPWRRWDFYWYTWQSLAFQEITDSFTLFKKCDVSYNANLNCIIQL